MEQSSLIKPVLGGAYPTISHGQGVFLYDKEGKDYLDASSGAVTANIGHGVQEIIEAMVKQAKQVSFVYRSQFTSDAAEKLAGKIAELTKGELTYSFFVNSGSEATETALKIAIQHWQEKGKPKKQKIISRWMSYHGITMGALSMSGHPIRRERFTPLLESYPSVSPPYCYRCPLQLDPHTCGMACASELEASIRRIGSENIAAFIAEPVIGAAGGAIVPPDGYFRKLKKICEDNDILFIADEVMTGFGRTGRMLASEYWDVEPDIVTFGKGMSGGYTPIAAAVMTKNVMEPIMKGSKSIIGGHTLSANPLSCAVSLAVLEYVERNELVEKSADRGNYLIRGLKKLAGKYSFIGDIRGRGLLIGIEFVQEKETKVPFPKEADVTNEIIELGMRNGILLYPAAAGLDGVTGAAIIISPPLTITEEECAELLMRADITFGQFNESIGKRPSQQGSES
ncbi:aspartate aminotransferase family protein [Peribacillus simplex]|uniref:Aspartate aminotransferase family protein n=1 Tax=Peribacillus simplex TaxID=1478 RepID=A0A8B5XWS2_9BACI|nr:aspartate aminotransferase family protein [Peribacillus simplex]MED3912593.1 aspartate aminotransferase family protein [Peribacillus simplex]MED3987583.1 aspartate aminotransferase family protein [Peribacillus simplex]MED4094206.1 aspartate aminotransferase family protein [Peribacillus simplex]TVX79467.1 aspartate aminotransferase family protein [Peribacillus simplex]CAH0225370.1 Adenosylmethionine-8-amino-7-oxononanoate aminotransferase [Peribacillus simplex]